MTRVWREHSFLSLADAQEHRRVRTVTVSGLGTFSEGTLPSTCNTFCATGVHPIWKGDLKLA
jgi:hypothetical protein